MAKKPLQNRYLLAEILESLYKKYNHPKFIPPDPLEFIYRYSTPADREIAGFLSSCFAYGAVEQINKFLTKLLTPMGKSPADFIKNFTPEDNKHLKALKYRFNTAQDIIDLISILKNNLNSHGSLEKLFLKGYQPQDENVIPALSNFRRLMIEKHHGQISKGLSYLICDPEKASSCKRLLLFLRWMVRKDNIDPGLWKKIDPAKLIIPVDVHMARLSRIIGLHNKKTVNLKTSIEITEGFRKICPADPAKYDFALCRIGIRENCTGKANPYCQECELTHFCRK